MKKISVLCLLGFILGVLGLHSCIKKNFDAPPDQTGYDPQLMVTHTIAELLAKPLHTIITQDIVVSGIVVMDDKNGNYYKKFVIQDSTGGLEINLDQNNIYNDYPVGRKVYIKAKGLTLTTYGGMIQIGYGIDERQAIVPIPLTKADDFIVKANYPNVYKIDTLDYDQLQDVNINTARLNTIIAIRQAQFVDTALPYADANATTNRKIAACNSTATNIALRTSNYAKFQPDIIPSGNGIIVGLYTQYNTTPQLIIRSTDDVYFTHPRCDASSPGTVIFSENFNSGIANNLVTNAGWTNFSEEGAVKYMYGGTSNPYVRISAFNTNQPNVISWLVTPVIHLSGVANPELSVRTTYGYPDPATFKAYITTGFNGDPTAANWIELDPITVSGLGNWSWQNINISLAAYSGQEVYIGFKYVGSSFGASATYELDDVKVTAN